MPLHPLAATGFADVAAAYERGRPDYPAAVVDVLGLPEGARVLDLAAGTGKLTRVPPAAGGARPRGVPGPAGRAASRAARLPGMRALARGAGEGTAEAIPLEDGS